MRLLVTREDYFAAAMKILATQGAGGLKINVLCKAVKVTTGSFYGYFGSFDGFVEQFLTFWKQEQTERLVALPKRRSVHGRTRTRRSLSLRRQSTSGASKRWCSCSSQSSIRERMPSCWRRSA